MQKIKNKNENETEKLIFFMLYISNPLYNTTRICIYIIIYIYIKLHAYIRHQ